MSKDGVSVLNIPKIIEKNSGKRSPIKYGRFQIA